MNELPPRANFHIKSIDSPATADRLRVELAALQQELRAEDETSEHTSAERNALYTRIREVESILETDPRLRDIEAASLKAHTELNSLEAVAGSLHGEKHDAAEARVAELENELRQLEIQRQQFLEAGESAAVAEAATIEANDAAAKIQAELDSLEVVAGSLHGEKHDAAEVRMAELETALRQLEVQVAADADSAEIESEETTEPKKPHNRRRTRDQIRAGQERRADWAISEEIIEPEAATAATESEPAQVDDDVVDLSSADYQVDSAAEPVDSVDTAATAVESGTQPEEMKEYLAAKRDFKAAAATYYETLTKAQAEKSRVARVFGLGRTQMNGEVQAAYDAFMESNRNLYQQALLSGQYEKLAARRDSRQGATNGAEGVAGTGIYRAAARRHVLSPAEKRLELQTAQLPERLRNAKTWLGERIKKNHTGAVVLGVAALGYGALVNTPGVAAGVATNYLGKRFYVDAKEKVRIAAAESANSQITQVFSAEIGEDVDLEALEQQYFTASNDAQVARTRVRAATVVAAAGAGAASEFWPAADVPVPPSPLTSSSVSSSLPSIENIFDTPPTMETPGTDVTPPAVSEFAPSVPAETLVTPETVLSAPDLTTPDISSLETAPDAESADTVLESSQGPASGSDVETVEGIESTETIVTVEKGDTLSKLVFSELRSQFAAGELTNLPSYVNADTLDTYLYQTFPEFTSATDVAPRLTPEQWQLIGVSSGDPHMIMPGEEINMTELFRLAGIATGK